MINANSNNEAKKHPSRRNSSGIGKKSEKKSKPPLNKLKPQKLKELEEHFFMDGITAYKAAKLVGVDYKTAKTHFKKWAIQLTTDDDYETWVDKNTRIKARALEGLANKIFDVRKIRQRFSVILERILDKIDSLERLKNSPKNTEKLESKVVIYELMVRKNLLLEAKLQSEYDTIEILPPAKEILDAEIAKHIRDYSYSQSEKTV